MRVRRDAYGVPHLWASTVDGLAHLQGRVTALDRGEQIEVERLRSEGRLASRVGPSAVPWDRFARRAFLDDTARRCHESADAETRRWVASYVEGVNSVLPGAPWHPWTPYGVFLVQHALFGTFPEKLWRARLSRVDPAVARCFAIEGIEGPGSGSNAWATAGLIAGDPHRVLELPGVYQQVGLAGPGFDVVGLAFPGVPGVPHFGHAGSVAWAVTNAMADYQDLYLEDGPTGGRVETIEVAGGEPVTVTVAETAQGPVIDDGISLRTPSRVLGSLGFAASLALLRARSVTDVEVALRDWVEPVNSVLTADATGAVRRIVAGRVPARAGRPTVPVPAGDPAYAWTGWVDLPRVETPVLPSVCANDRRPDVADLGIGFAPPHRAARIRTLLADGAGPEAVHMDADVGTTPARALLRRLAASALRDRLLAWDGVMAAGSRDAGLYAAWRSALARRLLDHPALRPLAPPSGFDPLFAPWTELPGRIGLALDGLIAGLPDIEPYASAALDALPDPPWGQRHVVAPVPVTFGAPYAVPPVPLSGDGGCVLATYSVPGVADACWRGPVARYAWDLTDRARSRWVVPFGASGDPASPHFLDQLPLWAAGRLVPAFLEDAVVYEEKVEGFGVFALTPVDPAAHAPLLHGWVTLPQNRFWGMGDHSVDEVREVYAFLDGLTTHHAYLLLLDERPIGIFQTYDPANDPVGERYDVQPGDIGMHILLSPGRRPPRGLTDAIRPVLARFVFRDPSRLRVVVEPDVRNARAQQRLRSLGFDLAAEIDMPDKRAQLAFMPRSRIFPDE